MCASGSCFESHLQNAGSLEKTLNRSFDKCVSDSLQTPSSKNSRTPSKSSFLALALLATVARADVPAPAPAAEVLTAVPSRDRKVVKRWSVTGQPRGVALGADGTIYVGLAEPQAVLAVDGRTGEVRKRLVLDSEEIASTKELVTLRTDPQRKRLFIANGSDESATILSLPDLAVLREITMEGEVIRDILPDPRGRYVYVLGRRVHVFDGEGDRKLRTLDIADPMAIATTTNGAILGVIASEDFGVANATVAALLDTTAFQEIARDPMQTDKVIEGAFFAGSDRTLIAFSRDSLFEKPLAARQNSVRQESDGTVTLVVGDLVNSEHVCLPEGSGPQIATLTSTDTQLVYAERRCSSAGSFTGSTVGVTAASLYGVTAYAVAYDKSTNTIVATDKSGFLTIYNVPRAAVAK